MTTADNPAEGMTDREIFVKVFWDTIGNALWYGGVTIIITVIGNYFWWLGVILFAIVALIMAIGTLQTFFVTLLGIVIVPFAVYRKLKGDPEVDLHEQLWMGAANIVRFVDTAIVGAYVFWLAWFFFWKD